MNASIPLTLRRSTWTLACLPLLLATPSWAQAPDDANQNYQSANGLLNRGLYDLAAEEYAKFLRSHADDERVPVARYGLAVCRLRTQKYDEAIEQLQALKPTKSFEFAAEAAAMLGQCHLAQKQYGPAAEAFERVLRDFGDHDLADDAAALLADALLQDGKYDAAAKRCEQFARRWASSPLRERVDFTRCLAEVGRKDYPAAAQRLEAFVTAYANAATLDRALLLLAQCSQQTGAGEAAAKWYRQLLSRPASEQTPDALLGLATVLTARGEARPAAELLDQLLQKYPQSPLASAARMQRGRVWLDSGEYDKAIASLDPIAAGDGPEAMQAEYWAAKCRLRKGQAAEAAEKLTRAIAKYSDSELLPEMRYDRAVALLRSDKPAEAIAALAEFLDKHAAHALAAEALHLLAATEHQQQHYDRSQELCRDFQRRYAKHELTQAIALLMAENDFLSQRYAEALAGYERCAKTPDPKEQPAGQPPRAQWIAYRSGLCLYRLGKLDDAAKRLAPLADAASKTESLRFALLALGDIAFQRGDWKAAEQSLAQYLAGQGEPPAADDAWLKLGLARQRQDNYDAALQAYDTLLSRFAKSPQRLQALFERGQSLAALKRTDEARKAFEQVLAEGADSRFAAFANNHLAALAAGSQDFKQAAERYRLVLETNSEPAVKADALLRRGESLLALEDYKGAEAAFTQFLALSSDDDRAPQARARLALSLARQERYADAMKEIANLERGGIAKLDASLRRTLRSEQAWCLRKLDKANDAAKVYRDLLKEPAGADDPHALLGLAEIEAAAGRNEQAIELLERLQTLAQADAKRVAPAMLEPAQYRLGVCRFQLKQYKPAAETLEAFIAKFDKSALLASACYFCGEAWFNAGSNDKAAQYLGRVVESLAKDPAAQAALLRLGEAQAALQRWAASEKCFADYLDRYPKSEQWYQARFGVGWARENQGRHDEAIDAYRAVVAKHQGQTAARAQFQIGECLFAKKNFEEAVRELLKVDILYAYPEWSAAALYEAGRCFEQLNKLGEAKTQYTAVIEKHGKTRWAELAAQRTAALASAAAPPGRK